MGRKRKLTPEQILEVQQSSESLRDLALKYNVSYVTISKYRKLANEKQGTEEHLNDV